MSFADYDNFLISDLNLTESKILSKEFNFLNNYFNLVADFNENGIVKLCLSNIKESFKYICIIKIENDLENTIKIFESIFNNNNFNLKEIIPANKEYEFHSDTFPIVYKLRPQYSIEKNEISILSQEEKIPNQYQQILDQLNNVIHNLIDYKQNFIKSNEELNINESNNSIENVIEQIFNKINVDIKLIIEEHKEMIDQLLCKLNLENLNNQNLLQEIRNMKIKWDNDFINRSVIENQLNYLISKIPPVKFLGFEASKQTDIEDKDSGSNRLDDFNNFEDKSEKKGITVIKNPSAWITFELEREVEFQEIEISVFKGGLSKWDQRLSGAIIKTSNNNKDWKEVGKLTLNTNDIERVSFSKSKAKLIKFEHLENFYLGIGYLKVINLN